MDAHVAELPVAAKRNVVLRDLVALREVRIEVVLAVEDRAWRDLAAECQRDHQTEVHRLGVRDRQRAGVSQADRAGVDVRIVAERQLTAAEHLGARPELHMDLETDDRLVCVGGRAHAATGMPSKPSDCSSAYEASRILFSENAGPAS